jgi:uncharacterized protein YegP (UPF0339 family)
MKFIVYLDAVGEWRWHLRATNGRFVACSGEGFTRKADCAISIEMIIRDIGHAPVDFPGDLDAD